MDGDILYEATIVTFENHIEQAMYTKSQGSPENNLSVLNKLWHFRSAHASASMIREIFYSDTYGTGSSKMEESQSGKRCVTTKQTKTLATGKLYNNSQNITVHGDVCHLLQAPILLRMWF